MTHGCGNHRDGLRCSQKEHDHRKGPANLLDDGLPWCERSPVEEVLARRIVMSHDHDGTIALDDIGAGSAMDADDVLAANLWSHRIERIDPIAREQDEHK